jgi:branched-chain amino acid aminotransferase
MQSEYIWMDGKFVPYEQATVHILSPSLHYGVGVFEGIRAYHTPTGPAVFRLRDHLTRFRDSIHILGIRNMPYSVDELREAVHETIRRNRFSECYIRPLMYLDGPLGLNMDNSKPRIAIATWEWGPYLGEAAMETGIHLMVSSFTRLHPNINMTKSKVSGNYVNSMLVKTLALRSGYDEAVILDPNGFVAECTGENIFMIHRGTLFTPPLATILEGITRNSILTLANDMGIPIEEALFTRDQLYIADEVFITGTAAEMVGVRMIDHRVIGEGKPGPITSTLQEKLVANLHGVGIHSGQWLDYVC